MEFTRDEVLEIVDGVLHAWASSYRFEGIATANAIMDAMEKENCIKITGLKEFTGLPGGINDI